MISNQRPSETLPIHGRELFVDNSLIAEMDEGLGLHLHAPVEREIAIVHDAEWEGNVSTFHTVFQDGNRFRMYYRGSHLSKYGGQQRADHAEFACYAESGDGIRWQKPCLDVVPLAGSGGNNILWQGDGAHDLAPFLDRNPAAADSARYKAVARTRIASNTFGLNAFSSPDGIHWQRMGAKPVITDGHFDSLNVAFWDENIKAYACYYRDFCNRSGGNLRDGTPIGDRAIKVACSDDFLNWSEGRFLDFGDSPADHLYTNAIQIYHRAPHLYLGFPMRFVQVGDPNDPQGNVCDALFMSSRDGVRFHRWDEAVVRPGLRASRWVHRNNLPACGLLETAAAEPGGPPELSFFTSENYGSGDASCLRRHTWRLDGFVSVRARRQGGVLRTQLLGLDGAGGRRISGIRVNLSTSAAGFLRAEIFGADGRTLPGFGMEDSLTLRGDGIDLPLRWKGGEAPPDLSGCAFGLRLELCDADLYAMEFHQDGKHPEEALHDENT